jgi:hypothetical protein
MYDTRFKTVQPLDFSSTNYAGIRTENHRDFVQLGGPQDRRRQRDPVIRKVQGMSSMAECCFRTPARLD